jgi:hypothetical protein
MSAGSHLARLGLAAALAASAAAAWLGYQRPGFLVWLANAGWLCG